MIKVGLSRFSFKSATASKTLDAPRPLLVTLCVRERQRQGSKEGMRERTGSEPAFTDARANLDELSRAQGEQRLGTRTQQHAHSECLRAHVNWALCISRRLDLRRSGLVSAQQQQTKARRLRTTVPLLPVCVARTKKRFA